MTAIESQQASKPASQQASKQGRFEADSRQKTRLVIGRRANGSYRVENGVRKAGREGLSCDIGTVMRGSIARRLKYDGLCKFRVYLEGERVSE